MCLAVSDAQAGQFNDTGMGMICSSSKKESPRVLLFPATARWSCEEANSRICAGRHAARHRNPSVRSRRGGSVGPGVTAAPGRRTGSQIEPGATVASSSKGKSAPAGMATNGSTSPAMMSRGRRSTKAVVRSRPRQATATAAVAEGSKSALQLTRSGDEVCRPPPFSRCDTDSLLDSLTTIDGWRHDFESGLAVAWEIDGACHPCRQSSSRVANAWSVSLDPCLHFRYASQAGSDCRLPLLSKGCATIANPFAAYSVSGKLEIAPIRQHQAKSTSVWAAPAPPA